MERGSAGRWSFPIVIFTTIVPQLMLYFLMLYRVRLDRMICRSVWRPGRHEWCSPKTSVEGHDLLKDAARWLLAEGFESKQRGDLREGKGGGWSQRSGEFQLLSCLLQVLAACKALKPGANPWERSRTELVVVGFMQTIRGSSELQDVLFASAEVCASSSTPMRRLQRLDAGFRQQTIMMPC